MPVGSGFADKERLDAEHVARFKTLMTTRDGVSSHTFINKQLTGCFAGKDYFCVSPSGDLLPCYFMPLSVGNIKTMSLREAHKIALSIPIFAERFPVCYVAASENFYKKCLAPLHEKYKTLPVNITEHPEVLAILKQFDMSNL
jgi:MoaA/NifB/PqqE/SkfB family radical SAM enzyme